VSLVAQSVTRPYLIWVYLFFCYYVLCFYFLLFSVFICFCVCFDLFFCFGSYLYFLFCFSACHLMFSFFLMVSICNLFPLFCVSTSVSISIDLILF
jgi:hypothetical protein